MTHTNSAKFKGNTILSSANIRQATSVATVNDGGNPVVPHQAAINQQKSPISQLPTETLTSIIHWVLPYAGFTSIDEAIDSWEYMRDLYALRQVSKRWHDVIDGTPSFWTVIHSTLPPHVNNATILRSASRPLAIVYVFPYAPNIHGHPYPEEFLGTIVHTRSRWSAVALDTGGDEGMSEYLANPAPLLRTLIIRSQSDDDMEPLELPGGQTPNLRHVQVSGVLLQWRTGLFLGLKSLSLIRIDLMVSHVIDLLHTNPDLEELCIHGYFETPTNQTSNSMITLSNLKSIQLNCDRSSAADYILQHIRLPSCLRFDLSLGDQDEDYFDYSRFMHETMDPFWGILRDIHIENGGSKMSVRMHTFGWQSLTGVEKRRSFSISIHAFCPIGVRWVGQILQDESGLQVVFSYHAVLGDVLTDLAPLRCVTDFLVAGDHAGSTHEILRFLRQPLSPSASTPSLPCLRELLITTTGWNAQALLDMVRQRRTAFSKPTLDQPPFTIKLERGAFMWGCVPRPIIDLDTLSQIKETEGVECVQFVGEHDVDGTLAITWNEETLEPTRG